MGREQISSPSWKQIRVRSSSLPRITIDQRAPAKNTTWANSSWLPNARTSSEMRSSSSGIHGPHGTTTTNRKPLGSPIMVGGRSVSPPRPRRTVRRTPVLTLALLKLDEQLLPYCRYLKDPSYENVTAACALLDSTVATASPGNSERSGSPVAYYVGSPLATSPGSRSPKSPIASWLTGGGTGESPSPSGASQSALALEGEWEKIVVPFFLLAGAEAVYADLGHSVDDGKIARNLIGLYTRIHKDIQLVQQMLCDPFALSEETKKLRPGQPSHLPTTTQPEPTIAMYLERASSVATALRALANLAQIRCQLIQLHSSMWETTTAPSSSKEKQQQQHEASSSTIMVGLDFGELGRSFQELLPSLPREGAQAQPMCDALERELKAWMYLIEMAFALEGCRFAETILNAQRSKRLLDRNSKTCMQLWLKRSLQHMISIMPIVFDRIETFSKPLYGFNRNLIRDTSPEQDSNRLGPDRDIEFDVLDFLQRQEKAGSPAIAVSVVLDAGCTANLRVERGFTLTDASAAISTTVGEGGTSAMTNPSESVTDQWPAVYMRTTIHHGMSAASSTSGGILGGMRRNTTRKDHNRLGMSGSRSHEDDPTSASIRSTSSNILRSWSHDASPTSAQDSAKIRQPLKQMNVLEYAPESGSATSSWPHSSWKSVVALLIGTGDPTCYPATSDATAITNTTTLASFGHIEVDLKTLSLPNWSGLHNTPTANTNSPPQTPVPPNSKLAKSDSIHVSALSNYLWLVVMIKGEEESRWHRRRSRADIEEEVRHFLKELTPLLRMSNWFSSKLEIHQLRQWTLKSSSTRPATSTNKSNSFQQHGEHGLINVMKMERNWDDDDLEELLGSFKELFGLRPPRRPMVGPLRQMSSYGLSIGSAIAGFKRSPRFTNRRVTRAATYKSVSLQTSAAALFLGVDLMHAVGE